MNIFLSILFSILMLFGTGSMREKALSAKYQDGSWSGSSVGIPAAYVQDGLLYVNGEPADYPADSSVSYYVKPVATTNKGTWFLEKTGTNSIYILRLDYRGFNIKTHNLSSLTFGADKVETVVNEENDQIEITAYFPVSSKKGNIVWFIEMDPEKQPKPTCS